MAEEKTILVKKKDGSFVRMKLSDLKKDSNAVVTSKGEEKLVNKIAENITARPIIDKKDVSESEKITLTVEDLKSPLEDEDISKLDYKTFNKRDKEAEEILEQLSYKLTKQARENVKKLLIFLLKDIKSEEQTEEILIKPVYLGGADLTVAQIKELFNLVEIKKKQISAEKDEIVAPLKKKGGRVNLPAIEENILPSTTSPFNSFVHKPVFTKQVKEIKSLDELVENNLEKDILADNNKFEQKVVEDILPPKEFIYGPIDEIKNFSLIDFRRLSSKVPEATNRLKQKFLNLKEESFLLYLQALEAWQQSPLYREYLQEICASLNQGLPLSETTKNKNSLTAEEIKMLIKMEKEI